MQLQLDPAIPPNLSPDELRDFKSFLDVALDGLTAAAGGEIFTTGNAMWTALSLIVVVLTGAKVAFSGTIQPWEIIKMVIGLWIPWVMLQFYTTLIPGMAFTFPGMIAAGGNWLHNLLIGDAVYAMQTELGNLVHTMTANLEAQAEQGDILGVIRGGLHSLLTLIAGVVMTYFMVLMLVLLAAITYAQVIWAQIALAILIILGPMFIPFLVFDPLAFLFWGWFRAMITYSLYAVIAGAVLRVFSAVGIAYVTELGECQPRPPKPLRLGTVGTRHSPPVHFRDSGQPQVRRAGFDACHRRRSGGERVDGYGDNRRVRGGDRRSGSRRQGGRGRTEMSKPKIQDAGAEYAEIWGETVHTNRHLRVVTVGLGIALLLVLVVVIRIVTVDPPRPIVVRVDEVGRAEAVAYEAMEAQGEPAGPHHQILPQSLHLRLLLAAAGNRARELVPKSALPYNRTG